MEAKKETWDMGILRIFLVRPPLVTKKMETLFKLLLRIVQLDVNRLAMNVHSFNEIRFRGLCGSAKQGQDLIDIVVLKNVNVVRPLAPTFPKTPV